jgi:acyl carrier protein
MEVNNTSQLHQVFREVFGLDSVADSMTRNDVPEWNSMQTINLVLALEETFGVQLTPEDVTQMLSVELVKAILTEKGVVF